MQFVEQERSGNFALCVSVNTDSCMYNTAMHVRAGQETPANRHVCARLRAMVESGHARNVVRSGKLAAFELVTNTDHDCE